MSRRKKDRMNCFIIGIIIILVVLIFGVLGIPKKAESTVKIEDGNLIFSGEDKARVVIELEENLLCKEILYDYKTLSSDYKLNINDLYGLLENHKKTIKQSEEIISGYEQYIVEREEICELEVTAAKTTFRTKVVIFGAGFSSGALLILILLL